MELRTDNKKGYKDEIIFAARTPAELIEEELTNIPTDEELTNAPKHSGEEEE